MEDQPYRRTGLVKNSHPQKAVNEVPIIFIEIQ